MIRTVFTPRWLLALVVAAVFAVVCVLLGRWQWGRYEDKLLRADTVTSHYGAPPVPLSSALPQLPLSERGEWTRITATGSYAGGQQLFVRNRALAGSAGLEVLVPLDLDDGSGRRLLVDRGWVQNADSAADLPSVAPAPAGTVTVQGWLRRPEVDLGKNLPPGQLASINVADARAQVGGDLLETYLVLESETTPGGGVPARPAPLEVPDTDLGPNQAYAFQWWLFSVFGFVFYGYRVRALREELRGGGSAGEVFADGPSPTGTLIPVGPPLPPRKPRKVRIWDEEDG
ncbi:MAG: SURF1 family protein [Lapillicoccus sp.]